MKRDGHRANRRDLITQDCLWRRTACAISLAAILLSIILPAAPAHGANFADSAFLRVWQRTDAPVRAGTVARTWIWGPEPRSGAEMEAYRDAPGGSRLVQYFDKSRMELTDPRRDHATVTNGLLALELVTGRLQLGDDTFAPHTPSTIPVAGDADDLTGPTYATFDRLRALPARDRGAAITATLARDGTVTDDPRSVVAGKATAREYVPETGHTVADVFWAFMTASGAVDGGGIEPLFSSPFYATGLPITEAYWSTVRVAGEPRMVLIQLFERRALTYTPGNPAGFAVEAGNVGQHYRMWRTGLSGTEAVSTPAPAAPSLPAPPINASSAMPSRAALIAEVTPGEPGGSANTEHITLVNGTEGPLNLTGWTLRDTHDHVFTFNPFTLPVDGTVTVHTGKGTDSPHDRYWGQSSALLSASGPETITLRDANGAIVDTYPYP